MRCRAEKRAFCNTDTRVAASSLYQPGKTSSIKSGLRRAANPSAKAGVLATVLNTLGTTPRYCRFPVVSRDASRLFSSPEPRGTYRICATWAVGPHHNALFCLVASRGGVRDPSRPLAEIIVCPRKVSFDSLMQV